MEQGLHLVEEDFILFDKIHVIGHKNVPWRILAQEV